MPRALLAAAACVVFYEGAGLALYRVALVFGDGEAIMRPSPSSARPPCRSPWRRRPCSPRGRRPGRGALRPPKGWRGRSAMRGSRMTPRQTPPCEGGIAHALRSRPWGFWAAACAACALAFSVLAEASSGNPAFPFGELLFWATLLLAVCVLGRPPAARRPWAPPPWPVPPSTRSREGRCYSA